MGIYRWMIALLLLGGTLGLTACSEDSLTQDPVTGPSTTEDDNSDENSEENIESITSQTMKIEIGNQTFGPADRKLSSWNNPQWRYNVVRFGLCSAVLRNLLQFVQLYPHRTGGRSDRIGRCSGYRTCDGNLYGPRVGPS